MSRREIVVGVDGSPAAAAALSWALGHSRLTGVPLRIVHVWQMTASPLGAPSASFWEASGADARARATRWVLDTLGGGAATVRWLLDVAEGSPGPILVDRARDATLLVVGTGEHVGLRRLVSGSVSHYALSHSVPPVVAVPAIESTSSGPAPDAVLEFADP